MCGSVHLHCLGLRVEPWIDLDVKPPNLNPGGSIGPFGICSLVEFSQCREQGRQSTVKAALLQGTRATISVRSLSVFQLVPVVFDIVALAQVVVLLATLRLRAAPLSAPVAIPVEATAFATFSSAATQEPPLLKSHFPILFCSHL